MENYSTSIPLANTFFPRTPHRHRNHGRTAYSHSAGSASLGSYGDLGLLPSSNTSIGTGPTVGAQNLLPVSPLNPGGEAGSIFNAGATEGAGSAFDWSSSVRNCLCKCWCCKQNKAWRISRSVGEPNTNIPGYGPLPEHIRQRCNGVPFEWTLWTFRCQDCGDYQMYRYHFANIDAWNFDQFESIIAMLTGVGRLFYEIFRSAWSTNDLMPWYLACGRTPANANHPTYGGSDLNNYMNPFSPTPNPPRPRANQTSATRLQFAEQNQQSLSQMSFEQNGALEEQSLSTSSQLNMPQWENLLTGKQAWEERAHAAISTSQSTYPLLSPDFGADTTPQQNTEQLQPPKQRRKMDHIRYGGNRKYGACWLARVRHGPCVCNEGKTTCEAEKAPTLDELPKKAEYMKKGKTKSRKTNALDTLDDENDVSDLLGVMSQRSTSIHDNEFSS